MARFYQPDLTENVDSPFVWDGADALRDKFGLLNLVDLDFPDFAPPDTQMASGE
jgi:hypothetical protein